MLTIRYIQYAGLSALGADKRVVNQTKSNNTDMLIKMAVAVFNLVGKKKKKERKRSSSSSCNA